jgi:hypothetical protein
LSKPQKTRSEDCCNFNCEDEKGRRKKVGPYAGRIAKGRVGSIASYNVV